MAKDKGELDGDLEISVSIVGMGTVPMKTNLGTIEHVLSAIEEQGFIEGVTPNGKRIRINLPVTEVWAVAERGAASSGADLVRAH